jgi:DNA-binding CsgD family transcriptional regulator
MCVHENAAGALCALGRPGEAAEVLGDEEGSFTSNTLCLHMRLAKVALLQGDLDAAAARLERARATPDVEAMILMPECAMQADVALWRGDLDTALAAVRTGEAELVEDDRLAAAELLAVALRAQADAAEAGAIDPAAASSETNRLLTRLHRVARSGQSRLPEPDVQLRLGEAERSRLDPTPDPAPWQAAAAGWEALGRPYEAAYAEWRLAQALAGAHAPRDELERALQSAHAAAGTVGAAHLVEAIEGLARRTRVALPGMQATDGSAFPGLTAREREVLALVADGRTNRQIAETLFITEKTASVHVSNILGKLGAANRGEAAALARRVGFELEPSPHG